MSYFNYSSQASAQVSHHPSSHNYIPQLFLKMGTFGDSLMVQWLGLHSFTAEGTGSIPGRGTKILQAAQRGQK